MLNTWIGTGRITKDLELKQVGTGTDLLNFSIAVERNFKNSQGERETDFINVVAWRALAKNIAQYFKKGDGIGITGSIQTRNYENNEGRTIYITEIVADSFDFPIQNKNQQQSQSNNKQSQSNSNPFENVGSNNDPFASNETTILDSDLPF